MRPKELFRYRIFTVSNVLTFSRVALVPLIWYFIEKSRDNQVYVNYALITGIIMVLTDFFDGYLARLLGQQTPLGQYLDPIADKLSVLAVLYLLVYYRDFPLSVFLFILARELLGTWGGAYLYLKKGILGKPNYWGKVGVGLVAVSAVIYLLDYDFKHYTLIPLVFVFIGGIAGYAKTYWKTAFGSRDQDES